MIPKTLPKLTSHLEACTVRPRCNKIHGIKNWFQIPSVSSTSWMQVPVNFLMESRFCCTLWFTLLLLLPVNRTDSYQSCRITFGSGFKIRFYVTDLAALLHRAICSILANTKRLCHKLCALVLVPDHKHLQTKFSKKPNFALGRNNKKFIFEGMHSGLE